MRSLPPATLLSGLLLGAALRGADPVFLSAIETGRARAAQEKKQLVIEFSGRTWCPACQALLGEVLTTPEFAAFARDRVLVHLDYPRRAERTPEKIAANPALARLMALKDEWKIEGFPTVILLAPDGRELGRVLGYEPGAGPVKFLTALTGGP